jgi:hypothetical protein
MFFVTCSRSTQTGHTIARSIQTRVEMTLQLVRSFYSRAIEIETSAKGELPVHPKKLIHAYHNA